MMKLLGGAGQRVAACFLGLVAAPLVDYGAAGIALTFTAWLWLRGDKWALWAALASLAGICVYNGNAWALVAIPLVWALGDSRIDVPRWRWLFLGYYVGHLAVLATISGGMDVSGNLADSAGAGDSSASPDDQGPRAA
jgi:hypothetical protein